MFCTNPYATNSGAATCTTIDTISDTAHSLLKTYPIDTPIIIPQYNL